MFKIVFGFVRVIFSGFWKRTEWKLQSFDWEKDQKPKVKWAQKSP